MTCGIYLLLGSNLGDKLSNIQQAVKRISQIATIENYSSIYETAAWGKTDQPSFYNTVLKICSPNKPAQLLNQLLTIEQALGRVRKEKWGERIIDIDILYFQQTVVELEHLKIPHPGIIDRKFTLVPLVEIAASFSHPEYKKTNEQLLEELDDNSSVIRLSQTLEV